MVDPTLSLSPDFQAAHPGYSIILSPGVSNGPAAVPEPATWAMMIRGFACLGAINRREKGPSTSGVSRKSVESAPA